jgi:hypothetical protein
MFAEIKRHRSNAILAILGAVAIVHSLLYFGTGTLPEAILAAILFLKAFTGRRQPWSVPLVGILALVLTWIVNASRVSHIHLKEGLSWLGIAAFAILAFSRYTLERFHTPNAPDVKS